MRRDAARAGSPSRSGGSAVPAAPPATADGAEARVLERCPVPPVVETPVRTGSVQKGGATLLPRLPMIVLALALVAGATSRAAAEAPSLEICGNCIDDDGDGKIDARDPECTGVCDNTEDSFFLGIPGAQRPQRPDHRH